MHPNPLLRLEGFALGLVAAAAYFALDGSPLLFVVLVVAPDVSMVGYLVDSAWGSRLYNLAHGLTLPVLLLGLGFWTGTWLATAGGLAWVAHVGADRTFGLGLKYPDASFGETHFQRL